MIHLRKNEYHAQYLKGTNKKNNIVNTNYDSIDLQLSHYLHTKQLINYFRKFV